VRAAAAIVAAVALALVPAAAGAGFPVGLDISTGRVNGKAVLGRTLAGVIRLFGRPDSYLRTPNVTYVRYGPPLTFSLLVLFRTQGKALVAHSLAFQDPATREVRLGRVLAQQPGAIERALRRRYGRLFRLAQPYACSGGEECSGEFRALSGTRRITFGLAAGHPFVTLWAS
jgi:hypothetical protein